MANPLRFDFRPLPDSPLLGAGTVTRQQVGTFLFDPDERNGQQRFTFKGNELDMQGQPRGDRPTIGAIQNPLPGAKAYYLAPDGRDASDRGTRQAPWATADYALARLRPGDVLVLLPGTYRQPLVVRRSGTPQDFLHIVAENPPYETPAKFPTTGPSTIDAAGLGNAPAILLDGCAHVRVAGLRVINSAAPAAVELRDTRDCVVEYVFVEPNAGVGIRATGRGNTLYECSVAGGSAGYELAGSLTDVRWCASRDNPVGFRAIGPVAGLHLLQNRHHGGQGGGTVGFDLGTVASDVVLDGNWVESVQCGYQVGGQRVLLANNNADQTGTGIRVTGGDDVRRVSQQRAPSRPRGPCPGRSSPFGPGPEQRPARRPSATSFSPRRRRPGTVWADYNLYSRAVLPFQFQSTLGDRGVTGLTAWSDGHGPGSQLARRPADLLQTARSQRPLAGAGGVHFGQQRHAALQCRPLGCERVSVCGRRDVHPGPAAELAAARRPGAPRVRVRRAALRRGPGRAGLLVLGPRRLSASGRQPHANGNSTALTCHPIRCPPARSARIPARVECTCDLPADAQEPCPIGQAS